MDENESDVAFGPGDRRAGLADESMTAAQPLLQRVGEALIERSGLGDDHDARRVRVHHRTVPDASFNRHNASLSICYAT